MRHEYRLNKTNWEDAEVLKYYPKTNKLGLKITGRKRKLDLKVDREMIKMQSSEEWNPMGVLQSFLNFPELHKEIDDVVEICEMAQTINSTQANTERTVKVLGLLAQGRYHGKYTEITKAFGKRDRLEQDTILKKLQIPLEHLPQKSLRNRFYKAHKPALMKNPTRLSTTLQSMKSQESKYKF